jgi:hypothetical protein
MPWPARGWMSPASTTRSRRRIGSRRRSGGENRDRHKPLRRSPAADPAPLTSYPSPRAQLSPVAAAGPLVSREWSPAWAHNGRARRGAAPGRALQSAAGEGVCRRERILSPSWEWCAAAGHLERQRH